MEVQNGTVTMEDSTVIPQVTGVIISPRNSTSGHVPERTEESGLLGKCVHRVHGRAALNSFPVEAAQAPVDGETDGVSSFN